MKKNKEAIDPKKDPWRYYKMRMTAYLAMGWEVKKETKWYTDIKKDNTTYFGHIVVFLFAPIIGNLIYDYFNRETKRILKPLKY